MKTPKSEALIAYYRWHSWIYDYSRWAFLFGRSRLIEQLAKQLPRHAKVLELGCGTGTNIQKLLKLRTDVQVIGIDLSDDMLVQARKNLAKHTRDVHLLHGGMELIPNTERFDAVICSYVLSMTGTKAKSLIGDCAGRLKPDGIFAVVDFQDSPFTWFKRWMQVNHVAMDGHLLGALEQHFPSMEASELEQHKAYAGLWRWCCGWLRAR